MAEQYSDRPDDVGAPPGPWALAGFAVVLHVALVVCAYGMISLFADIDPVGDVNVGRVPVPFAIGFSSLVLLVVLGRAFQRSRSVLSIAVLAAVGSWGSFVAALAAARIVGSTAPVLENVVWALTYGIGWFGLVVPAVAAVVASVAAVVARGGTRRPRWPWEDEFDE